MKYVSTQSVDDNLQRLARKTFIQQYVSTQNISIIVELELIKYMIAFN
jgi:hypothetical protein